MDPLGVSQIGSPAKDHTVPNAAPATPAKDYSPAQKSSEPWARASHSQHHQQLSPRQPLQHAPAVQVPPSPNAWSQQASSVRQPPLPNLQHTHDPGPIMPSPWSAASTSSDPSGFHQQQGPPTPSKEPRSPFSEDGVRSRSVARESLDERPHNAQRPNPNKHADLQGHEAAAALLERDRKHGFVRIRVLGVDRAKKDFFVKLEANSNLSTFHHSQIRPFSRALNEFVNLHASLAANHPHLVLPALPLPATSAATEEEEDRLLKISFQKWCDRITKQFDLARDEELRNFLESDFNYQPTTLKRRLKPSASGFALPLGKGKGASDDDLGLIKLDMTKLESQYNDTARSIDKDGRHRKLFSSSLLDLSEQFKSFAATESHPPLATGFRKMAEGIHRQVELQSSFGTAECVTLADALMYASNEAKEAKDALVQRQLIVDEQRIAAKAALTKKRAVEKLRNSGSIKPDRVHEALEDYNDASKHDQVLTQRLQAVSTKLQPSVIEHAKHMHEDLFSALLVHSKAGLAYEKHALKDLEALRNDIKRIPPKRAEDAYIVNQPPPQSARLSASTSAPPRASSYPRSSSPSLHSPQPSRASNESDRGHSHSASAHRETSSSGYSSPPPPGGPVHAQSMFVPPTHRPSSAQQPSRINDLARSVVLVPGSGGSNAPQGQKAASTGRRGLDDRQRVDAKMAASKLATMFNS